MDPIHLFIQWSCKVLVVASLIEGIQKGGHHFLMGNPPTVVSLVYCTEQCDSSCCSSETKHFTGQDMHI